MTSVCILARLHEYFFFIQDIRVSLYNTYHIPYSMVYDNEVAPPRKVRWAYAIPQSERGLTTFCYPGQGVFFDPINRVANISADNNNDKIFEVVQSAMLPIINQDLLLNLKDSRYVDMVVPNNPKYQQQLWELRNCSKHYASHHKSGYYNKSEY